MNARVIGRIATPTKHACERVVERFPLLESDNAMQDIVDRIRNLDYSLIGYGRNCSIYKVLLYGLFPMRVYISTAGTIITITRMRRKK